MTLVLEMPAFFAPTRSFLVSAAGGLRALFI